MAQGISRRWSCSGDARAGSLPSPRQANGEEQLATCLFLLLQFPCFFCCGAFLKAVFREGAPSWNRENVNLERGPSFELNLPFRLCPTTRCRFVGRAGRGMVFPFRACWYHKSRYTHRPFAPGSHDGRLCLPGRDFFALGNDEQQRALLSGDGDTSDLADIFDCICSDSSNSTFGRC